MAEVIICFECREEIQDGEDMFHVGDGDYICEECRDNYYMYCEDCNELVHEYDIVAVDNNDRYVCEDCSNHYYTCDHCTQIYSEHHIAVNTIQLTLCDHCYSDYYFTCAGCDEVEHLDYGETVDGWYYCSSCAEEYRGPILPYSTKPEPIFYGGNAGYGVELEIDDGEYKREAARAIAEAGKDHIYLKEDGSLSSVGIEIVTHPATLDYHINHFPWSNICETALNYGYRSHDTNTCGLHIHASRSLFGISLMEQDLTIAKIMLLFDRWYSDQIVKFARRNLAKMRRWADKPDADIQQGDDNNTAINKAKKTANHRYKAINLCNSHTVEFRLFKGTLKRDTIIASIQWVDVLIRYCRETQLKDLFNVSWGDIFGNTGHAELTEYLKQRDLIKEDEQHVHNSN
jgi:hypothetical protein